MDFSPEVDNKLKAQGIRSIDLRKALILVRNLRIQIIKDEIAPKSARIAILFIELTDREFAQQKLTAIEMRELQLIAEDLFEIAKGSR